MTPHRIPAENLRSRSPVGVLKQRERGLPESHHNCPRRVFEWFRQEVADRPSLPCSTSGFPEHAARRTSLTVAVFGQECEPPGRSSQREPGGAVFAVRRFAGTAESGCGVKVASDWQCFRPGGNFRYKSAGRPNRQPESIGGWCRRQGGAGCQPATVAPPAGCGAAEPVDGAARHSRIT